MKYKYYCLMREIAGITVSKEDKCCLICVENFSEEIKEMLKNRLVAICHGDNRAANEPQLYPYNIVTMQVAELNWSTLGGLAVP